MKLSDLVTSKDGSLSLTKLAASTFHFLLAVGVVVHTVFNGFRMDMAVWMFYGGIAVGHAAYDKTKAINNDLDKRKLEAENAIAPQS